MKKLFILLIALISIVWAEVKIEMPIRIEFFSVAMFDFYFDNKDQNCLDLICLGENSRGEERFVCPTILDSNVLYGMPGEDVVEFFVLSGATHSWREAFEDELNRYRKCDVFVVEDSAYNDILTKIDSVLVPETEKYLQSNIKRSKALVFDSYQGRVTDFPPGTPGPVFEFYDYAMKIVNARNTAISSIAPAKYKLESIRVQNHQLAVSPKLVGREFVLFDVNGHELRRGTLQNNMQVPAYPTVIKIQGFGTKLLNGH